MFCATLFTHVGSQHLGPVGPPSGLVHRWAWQGCHRSLGAVARVEGGKGRIWKEHSLGGYSSGGALPILCHEGEEMGALSFPRQRAHFNPLCFEWERERNTKTWGNYA